MSSAESPAGPRAISTARIVVLAALMALALPTSADAATPGPTVSLGRSHGLEYFSAKFEGVVAQAGAPANCDGADLVTGGGGSIGGNTINALVNESYPLGGGSGWEAEGTALGGGARTVASYAICGTENVSYATYQVPLGGGNGIGAGVPCPASTDPIGGGISATGPGLSISATKPALPPSTPGWLIIARNTGQNDTLVDPFAVCSDAYGVRYRSTTENMAKGEAGKAIVSCKQEEAVLGGGIDSTRQEVTTYDAWTIASRPWDSKDRKSTPDDGWLVRAHNGSDHRMQVTAFAVCKRP